MVFLAVCLYCDRAIADGLPEEPENTSISEEYVFEREDLDVDEKSNAAKESYGKDSKIPNPRKKVGDAYLGVTRAVDNFLSGRKIENSVDSSYLKLESIYTEFESGESVGSSQLKFKLDLPKTEDRLKLFFGSELDEEDSLENDIRSVSTGEKVGDRGSVAGIELKPSKQAFPYYFKPSVSIGARLNDGVQGLFRIRVRNKKTYFGEWQFIQRHEAWVLDGDGWRLSNRIEFKKYISDILLFTTVTDTIHKLKAHEKEYGHRWILSKRHSPTFSMDYKLGHIRSDDATEYFDKHFVNFGVSKILVSNWLFASLTPEFARIGNDDWVTEKSITLKVDMFFTE